MKKAYELCVRALSSKWALWAIVALFIIESAWIALSFAYPLVYDEAHHFPVIQIFSHQWWPMIFNQPHSADAYGNITYGAASLYHYVMSFPYRLIEWIFPNRLAAQVVILRLINILMAASGLLLFSHLFRRMNIKQAVINVALLIFILIPLVPFIAATINYDNMLFPLTALYLILCLQTLKTKDVEWKNLSLIIIVGCVTSLVKEAFLPIFAVSIVYLIVAILRQHGKRAGVLIKESIKHTEKRTLVVTSLFLIAFISLFSLRYIQPTIQYGSPAPDCQQVMPADRCLDYSSQIIMNKLETKDERPIESFPQYALMWFSSSLETIGRVVAIGPGWGDYQKPLPVINTLLFLSIIGGVAVLIYAWRSLKKGFEWYFLATMSVALLIITFVFNYSLYLRLHYPFAIQPRYLLNFVPIVIVMMVIAVSFILRRSRVAKLSVLVIVLALFTQGGGTISYILRSKDFWYWKNPTVLQVNHIAKKILAPLVKEK